MSMNYDLYKIDLYSKNHARIHKFGKVCTLKTENNVKVLLEKCRKHNIYFEGRESIEGRELAPVIKDFENYYARKKRLIIIANKLDEKVDKLKLVKTNPTVGKVVVAATLAATLGITAMGLNNSKQNELDSMAMYETQATVEEIPEYIEEDIEKTEIELAPVINENPEVIEGANKMVDDTELAEMLRPEEFHFSYNDRTGYENLSNARRYQDIFEEYGARYGVDPNILMAIAAQENCGKHYEALNNAYATGIMQIERKPNLNSTVRAYNFETGEMDEVLITTEAIEDLETNIQIGTMIVRSKLEEYNYNIPLSLQSYNMGSGNMAKIINNCCSSEGLTKDEVKGNLNNPLWLNYRNTINAGDPQYIEHIFSYIPNETVVSVRTRDGDTVSMQIINDNVNTMQMA